jgi:hypothetical protein
MEEVPKKQFEPCNSFKIQGNKKFVAEEKEKEHLFATYVS